MTRAGDQWLADGFHRVDAAKKTGLQKIKAEVHQGSRVDALLHNLKANQTHGVRRTQVDKRRSIELVLMEESLRKRSSREIAKLCGVGHQLVETVRRQQTTKQVDDSSTSSGTTVRIGGDGKSILSAGRRARISPKRKWDWSLRQRPQSKPTLKQPRTLIVTFLRQHRQPVLHKLPLAINAENVDDGAPVKTDGELDEPLRTVVSDTQTDEGIGGPARNNRANDPDSAVPAQQQGLDVLSSIDSDQYWNENSRGWKEVRCWLSSAHDKLPLDHYIQQEKTAFDRCFTNRRGVSSAWAKIFA